MQYRSFGQSGLEVSEIGLGCEGLVRGDADAAKIFHIAVDAGVNILDMYSPSPVFRDFVGRMIREVSRHIVLQAHLCAVWHNDEYLRTRDVELVKRGFTDLLNRLGEQSVDIGMIHYVDSISDWDKIADGPIINYAKALREAGKIRMIGMSSHNPEVALKAVQTGDIQVLMFAVNPVYDAAPPNPDVEKLWARETYEGGRENIDKVTAELYDTCQQKEIPITVMKAFGGGDLLSAEDSPAGYALTVPQCIAYALDRPGVASVLAGVRTVQELDDVLQFEETSRSARDYAAALQNFQGITWRGHCMYCGHCAPCPEHIQVADVLKLYNLGRDREPVPETVADHYRLLDRHASDCTKCGACETRCPFGVEVRAEMDKAEELFGE